MPHLEMAVLHIARVIHGPEQRLCLCWGAPFLYIGSIKASLRTFHRFPLLLDPPLSFPVFLLLP